MGDLIGASLQRVKRDQDSDSFETLADIVHESLDKDMPEMAGLITHALFTIMSERKPQGDFRKEDLLQALSDDLNTPISSKWGGVEAGRLHYFAGRVAVHLSAWDTAQEFFRRSLAYFRETDMGFDQALTHQAAAGVYFTQGDLEASTASSLDALNWYEQVGDTRRTAEILLNLSQNSLPASVELAGGYLDRAEQLIQTINDGHLNASLLGLRAMIRVQSSDFEGAEPILRKALASARRRLDQRQEQDFSQNLANVVEESKGPRQALSWRLKALSVAEDRGDLSAQATLQRSVAITFARIGRMAEALPHMKRAVDLARDTKDQRVLAESMADLGAMMLSDAAGVSLTFDDDDGTSSRNNAQPSKSGEPPLSPEMDDQVDEALRYLELALETFLELRDSEWIQRVTMNRRNLIQKQAPEQAVRDLLSVSRQVKLFDEGLSADLIREAARTECQIGVDPSSALQLYRDAIAAHKYDHDSERAWALGEAAAELSALGEFHEEASVLLGEAVAIYTALDDPITAATASNDRGVALSNAGREREAIGVFESVAEIAETHNNRVLMEMAFNNLGEIWHRLGDDRQAIIATYKAAELAADLGDHAASVKHWTQVSGMLLNVESPSQADRALDRAREQAEADGTDEAVAFMESAEAARAFANFDFSGAAQFWVASSEKTKDWQRLERISFALEANARGGRSAQYRKLLGKFTDSAQSGNMGQEASEMLWRPARAWLGAGQPTDAALALGEAALLSISNLLDRRHRIDFSRLYDAPRIPKPLQSFYATLAQIATVLSDEDIPREIRAKCRTLMVQEWQRNQGIELAEFLDRQLRETEESLASEEP
ncbi:tetratricopeptide repeat protein [Pseudarthrobacter sp. J75]|uniref:tetratricopeptide repeat protein n=1 Tax=unclassified Pseudarthrobacter TaxID=2647000 RepID=UPI002E80F3F1|nr:tetratricopeptide repeat protein [Pseudarthrobacter sp. J75]MEE2522807.1 tetratricopeptide repeat protein [Pseudarthrobacter sp. J47]MEE2529668.1 tetratricopeptide repeat protein [Pseudarthrobacter sp. J75]